MRTCDELREMLGPYVDGEVSPETRAVIEAHICTCADCRTEVDNLRQLGDQISASDQDCVPHALWRRIEARLATRSPRVRSIPFARLYSFFAAAACLVLAVGGYFAIMHGVSTRAQAVPVDFSVLLDGLSIDAEKAFHDFIRSYHGRRVSSAAARQHASQLNFAVPERLPGGFDLNAAFELQIGDTPAAAAIYRRNGEFLGTIFHRAIHPEDYGTYRDHPCVVGEHRGHRVQVGEWRLVHVTDATTCHCVLSQLDETKDLPAILRAVAPDFEPATNHSHP